MAPIILHTTLAKGSGEIEGVLVSVSAKSKMSSDEELSFNLSQIVINNIIILNTPRVVVGYNSKTILKLKRQFLKVCAQVHLIPSLLLYFKLASRGRQSLTD